MNSNKNKNISNNYKDYKYVYTGYDEFIKSHHLDKKEIQEEKEKIVHDHRNVFDFNNPNQHQHDYSFDFNQNPGPPKETTTYKDKYGNTYNRKPTTQQTITTRPTSNNYSQPKYNYNQTTTTYKYNNNDKNAKVVRNIVLIIFFAPFIFGILSGIISFFALINETDDYETNISEEEIYNTYKDPIDALCDSIENNSYSYIWNYVLPEETQVDNGESWRKIIYNHDIYGTPNYSEQRICTIKSSYHPTSNELVSLEQQYQNKYNTTKLIEDGYQFEIIINGNDYQTKNYVVTTIKLDGEWYLFEIK